MDHPHHRMVLKGCHLGAPEQDDPNQDATCVKEQSMNQVAIEKQLSNNRNAPSRRTRSINMYMDIESTKGKD